MELTAQALDLTLNVPFRISRSVQEVAHNVLVQLDDDGLTGTGEAAPSGYFGEKCETVLVALSYFAEHLGDNPLLIEDISAELGRALHGNAAARAAIDMALYDLMGQRLGVPLYQLLGLNPTRTPVTSFTIGIDTAAEMARKVRQAQQFPVLKIKLGTPDDLEIVRAIRDATDARLRVDANAAWTPKQAIKTINALEPLGIEFVEQPVAASDLDGLRLVRDNTVIPIFADESCVTLDDVPKMAGRVDGINIKLMKCGGISQALKMIAAARAHHLQVMLGCMIESSVAITAAAQISPLVDFADLDGALLVSNDPFEGMGVERGKLVLSDRPGLGVRKRSTASLPTRRIRARSADHKPRWRGVTADGSRTEL
jgi:L-Ala-D/L-Glu epimerase